VSRIRSVHPGLFTDEAFMAASMAARVLLIGLWTEADDRGVFKWTPLTLKARLMPVDPVDVAALLDELVAVKFVERFEAEDGHHYGVIRNFCRFQRPKKPRHVHPLPDKFRNFVGLNEAEFPTGGEKSPQMEEGGGREDSPTSGDSESFFSRVESEEGGRSPIGEAAKTRFRKPKAMVPADWQPDDKLREFATAKAGWGPAECDGAAEAFRTHHLAKGTLFHDLGAGWRAWVLTAVKLNAGSRQTRPPAEDYGWDRASQAYEYAPESPAYWRDQLALWFDRTRGGPIRKRWLDEAWGPAPGEFGCRVPPEVLAEFGWEPPQK
jgi:hypothetical protein